MSPIPAVELLRGHLSGVAYRDLTDLLKAGGWPGEIPDEPVRATARIHLTTLTLSVAPASAECPDVPALPPASLLPFLLSPAEVQIIREVMRGPAKQVALAQRLGMVDASRQANSQIRYLLPNLAERGIIENSDDGYRLTDAFAAVAAHLPQFQG